MFKLKNHRNVLTGTDIPKLAFNTTFKRKYRSYDFYNRSSSSIALFDVKSNSSRGKGKLEKKKKNGSALYLFYQNQVITKSLNTDSRSFFVQPSWKLSLHSLYHTDTPPSRMDSNSFSWFRPAQDKNYIPPFKINDFSVRKYDESHSDLLSLSLRKMKKIPGKYCYLSETTLKKQIKSPILAYNYKIQTNFAKFLITNQSTKRLNAKFHCLLEAATRNWIITVQKNPFGKIMVFVARSNVLK